MNKLLSWKCRNSDKFDKNTLCQVVCARSPRCNFRHGLIWNCHQHPHFVNVRCARKRTVNIFMCLRCRTFIFYTWHQASIVDRNTCLSFHSPKCEETFKYRMVYTLRDTPVQIQSQHAHNYTLCRPSSASAALLETKQLFYQRQSENRNCVCAF